MLCRQAGACLGSPAPMQGPLCRSERQPGQSLGPFKAARLLRTAPLSVSGTRPLHPTGLMLSASTPPHPPSECATRRQRPTGLMLWALAQPQPGVLERQTLSTWAVTGGEGGGGLMSTMSERYLSLLQRLP